VGKISTVLTVSSALGQAGFSEIITSYIFQDVPQVAGTSGSQRTAIAAAEVRTATPSSANHSPVKNR
jgi:hypothetical protein